MNVTVTNTSGMICLAMNARGRNRSVYEDRLIRDIDPEGIHVLSFQMLHNDVEIRTRWMVKMRDTEEPQTIWLDDDFDKLGTCTETVEAQM